jgi:hypothetical protein
MKNKMRKMIYVFKTQLKIKIHSATKSIFK